MVRIFKTIDGAIHEIQEPQEGCWIALTNPTATEIFEISEQFGIEVDDLRAPLDEEERSRIEVEDNYTLILADVPAIEERNEKDWYVTIPLGIIVTQKMIFTVCLEDTQVLTRFMEGRVRNFFTYMKTRFILQILYRNASMYLRYLRIIDKKSEQIEEKLHLSTRNQELMELLELEKSLVYFTTSLRSNEMVLEKLLKVESIKKYPEDTELLQLFRWFPALKNVHRLCSRGIRIFGQKYSLHVRDDRSMRYFRSLWSADLYFLPSEKLEFRWFCPQRHLRGFLPDLLLYGRWCICSVRVSFCRGISECPLHREEGLPGIRLSQLRELFRGIPPR